MSQTNANMNDALRGLAERIDKVMSFYQTEQIAQIKKNQDLLNKLDDLVKKQKEQPKLFKSISNQ